MYIFVIYKLHQGGILLPSILSPMPKNTTKHKKYHSILLEWTNKPFDNTMNTVGGFEVLNIL